METPSIFVRQDAQAGVVKVTGKGSFKNARLIKAYADKARQQGVRDFVFDLSDCTYMDSTFMGILAGLASTQKSMSLPVPKVVRLSPRCRELLYSLGIDRVLDVAPELDIPAEGFQKIGEGVPEETKEETAQTMLEAHRNLIDANQANAPKFQDVIRFLQEKVGGSQQEQ